MLMALSWCSTARSQLRPLRSEYLRRRHHCAGHADGQLFALFVIVLAAAEAAVALASSELLQQPRTVDVDKADELRG